MARTSFRFVPNPHMYRELARSSEMRDAMKDPADRGKNIAMAVAPSYTGPTWDPSVQRAGDYKKSLYSSVSLNSNGWRGEFGATASHWAQVEFGSGRPATSQDRPQHGHSPKTRTLGRALDGLRSA